jgi:hypothetical protein
MDQSRIDWPSFVLCALILIGYIRRTVLSFGPETVQFVENVTSGAEKFAIAGIMGSRLPINRERQTMWIPTPIYERIPHFLVLLSLPFMSSVLYLGFDYELTRVYLATGIFCFVWGISLLALRRLHRGAPQKEQEGDAEQAGSQ